MTFHGFTITESAPSLSYAELLALEPCDARRRKFLFKSAERLTAREALTAGASISDLVWVAGRLGLKRQCVQYALACAGRAAHLNTDPRIQAALDAAQTWLDNPSDLNAVAAVAAARGAARAAASAVKAANAAANAANAAANAAYAATNAAANAGPATAYAAAYAACYAAAVYAAAAYTAEKEEQKKLFLEIFDPTTT